MAIESKNQAKNEINWFSFSSKEDVFNIKKIIIPFSKIDSTNSYQNGLNKLTKPNNKDLINILKKEIS